MKVLHIGDVVGPQGCEYLLKVLPGLKKEFGVDCCIVNGENCAPNNGIDRDGIADIFAAGADVITTGNHVWQRPESESILENDERILRPANFYGAPGNYSVTVDCLRDEICVISLMGTLNMVNIENPFFCINRVLKEISSKNILVDFHADASSEKKAMGYHLDGRVAAVVGTHTHVQTSDAHILPNGTGYITDVGMTGVEESVIGIDANAAIQRFLYQRNGRYTLANGKCSVHGVVMEIKDGKCLSIESLIR